MTTTTLPAAARAPSTTALDSPRRRGLTTTFTGYSLESSAATRPCRRGAVVDDYELVGSPGEGLGDRLDERLDVISLVVRRDDDGDRHRSAPHKIGIGVSPHELNTAAS
jgi:hypothetical protein